MNKMNLITVNEAKCIKCELCIKECPVAFLKMGSHGPEEIENNHCISLWTLHCYMS
ncbi:hypothetical protein CDIOL_22500 [Clostridium diolis]|uniref:4Fe-4S ferredoxin-type domain-containing protein n=1 Tax=Clostridium diolis TaxID=223919 RepID=A0AAV3W1V8_9CLOT|nr:hypothetical protein CDIOL_22500 [Clostridium diolis]